MSRSTQRIADTCLILTRIRVLPSVKKAVDSGVKLKSIINTHQSVQSYDLEAFVLTLECPTAMVITRAAMQRW